MPSARSSSNECSEDEEESTKRRLQHVACKYREVEVYLGDEDHVMVGTTRITRNIFAGNHDKTENAKVFLENLNKIKLAKDRAPLSKDSILFRSRADGDGMS